MKNMSMNNNFNVTPGTVIKGRWHARTYQVERLLGRGAVGQVYLATSQHGKVALKLSENSMGITSEVNVLKRLAEAQGSILGPSLIDVDDYYHPLLKKHLPFYVMEYIEGEHFIKFVQTRGLEWADILILQLLSDLDKLHQSGWVFGDLKPDNLIVTYPPVKIRCIDVGGTTRIGRSIKEFTEFFDRGYWEVGMRRAEPSYDLFAVAMIMINVVYPKRFSKKGNGKDYLTQMIESHPYLNKRKKLLTNALNSSYSSAAFMKKELMQLLSDEKKPKMRKSTMNSRTSPPPNRKQYKKKKKKQRRGVFETVFIVIFLAFLYSLYIFTNLL
ncbi:protein kinase family protein [Bacillus sp. FJAT-47783]|uniref:protein kinase domain-containing protein n=1 Tax=Bacillus sp. FJAT-47783 TaxID=2922712 RepID=UPI001FAC0AD3|nr:protein kinase family protein [Bacillus sp. FJAT-47783]